MSVNITITHSYKHFPQHLLLCGWTGQLPLIPLDLSGLDEPVLDVGGLNILIVWVFQKHHSQKSEKKSLLIPESPPVSTEWFNFPLIVSHSACLCVCVCVCEGMHVHAVSACLCAALCVYLYTASGHQSQASCNEAFCHGCQSMDNNSYGACSVAFWLTARSGGLSVFVGEGGWTVSGKWNNDSYDSHFLCSLGWRSDLTTSTHLKHVCCSLLQTHTHTHYHIIVAQPTAITKVINTPRLTFYVNQQQHYLM